MSRHQQSFLDYQETIYKEYCIKSTSNTKSKKCKCSCKGYKMSVDAGFLLIRSCSLFFHSDRASLRKCCLGGVPGGSYLELAANYQDISLQAWHGYRSKHLILNVLLIVSVHNPPQTCERSWSKNNQERSCRMINQGRRGKGLEIICQKCQEVTIVEFKKTDYVVHSNVLPTYRTILLSLNQVQQC